ncbi:hypothetical protein ASU31_04630 [Pedobacter ginsenosidimutans]|uniref:Uncharacterized protein n=1 Tax=Pedobacter ginsenosidimutans TaxID=687842 RepID=A0A0T5VT42_9SPHI|nr:hypothetical protein ASU31_04630 [Pedobacter ginsenosidimutans]
MFLGLKLMLFSIFITLFIKDGYCRHVMASYRYPTCNRNKYSILQWLHSPVMQKQGASLLEYVKKKMQPTLVKNIKFKAFDRILGRF